jgi:hypothetical protein
VIGRVATNLNDPSLRRIENQPEHKGIAAHCNRVHWREDGREEGVGGSPVEVASRESETECRRLLPEVLKLRDAPDREQRDGDERDGGGG